MNLWKSAACAVALAVAFGAASAVGAELPAARSMKGYLAQRSGEYSAALTHYKAALQEDPGSVELRLRLVRLLTVFGELDQALRALDEGLALQPGQGDLLFSKAKTLMMGKKNAEAADAAVAAADAKGGAEAFELALRLLDTLARNDQALALADKWIAAEPRNPDAASQHAFLLEKGGRPDEAEKEYRRALELKPDHHPTLSFLGRLLAQRGNRDEAIRLYQSALTAYPHDAEARLSLAGLYFDAGQPEKVKETLLEAQRWVKGPSLLVLRMGLLFLEIGEPEEALKVIETISEEERDERVWFFLGAARLGLDRYEQALEAFDRIPPASPLYPEVLSRRAQALHLAGRGDEAVAKLRAWLGEHKEDVEATLVLASLYATLNRHAEVIELLTAFTAGREVADPRVYFNLGVAYDKAGDWEKCIAAMRKVIALDPKHAHGLNYLGYLYADKGQNLDEAEELVKRAVALQPKNGFILDSLGWVYYQQKRYAEARTTLEASLALAPDDPVIWEHLGDACKALGDAAGARKAYENAVKLQPRDAAPNPGLLKKLQDSEGK